VYRLKNTETPLEIVMGPADMDQWEVRISGAGLAKKHLVPMLQKIP